MYTAKVPRVLELLTAIVRTVRFLNADLMTSCIMLSVSMSMDAVASSIMSILLSRRNALPRQNNWNSVETKIITSTSLFWHCSYIFLNDFTKLIQIYSWTVYALWAKISIKLSTHSYIQIRFTMCLYAHSSPAVHCKYQ